MSVTNYVNHDLVVLLLGELKTGDKKKAAPSQTKEQNWSGGKK